MPDLALDQTTRGAIRASADDLLPRASIGDAIGIIAGVFGPTLAKGVIIRRPWMVALAERFDLDTRAVRRMQRLDGHYGPGPLLIGPIRSRYWALALSPAHVRRALHWSPEPFATATAEKIAALSHFEPKMSLISQGAERADRRRFNEEALQTDQHVHGLGDAFMRVVDEEVTTLMQAARRRGLLTWSGFEQAWSRIVRRVAFGDQARDDRELTRLIERLRRYANWSGLWPSPDTLRHRFFERLNAHLARGEPGSLAGHLSAIPTTAQTAPSHQVPQWLFAFDPAGMTTFRTLALLASHPDHLARVRDEIRSRSTRLDLPYLRACVLESLRLWPTSPLLLRQTIEETSWEGGTMPAQTSLIIFTPYFQRDDRRLPYAHAFAPGVWLQPEPPEDLAIVPFSDGPAKCPGRQLVELLTSAMVAGILQQGDVRLTPPGRLDLARPLPGTLNNYALRFAVSG
jgi:hypothetical protein